MNKKVVLNKSKIKQALVFNLEDIKTFYLVGIKILVQQTIELILTQISIRWEVKFGAKLVLLVSQRRDFRMKFHNFLVLVNTLIISLERKERFNPQVYLKVRFNEIHITQRN